MTLALETNPWDDYVATVEHLACRRITDGRTVDMLYALFLGDIPAGWAARNLDGLPQASGRVQEALDTIQAATTYQGLSAAYRTIQHELLANQQIAMREEGNPFEMMPRPRMRFSWQMWVIVLLGAAGWTVIIGVGFFGWPR